MLSFFATSIDQIHFKIIGGARNREKGREKDVLDLVFDLHVLANHAGTKRAMVSTFNK